MRVGDDTWTAIRNAYEETTEPVSRIARRFEVSCATIRSRARRQGWTTRPAGGGERSKARSIERRGREEGATGSVASHERLARAEPDTPEGRIIRLFRVIDLQLDQMERHMSSGEPVTAQDQERHARALGAILGNIEKATDAAAELLKASGRKDGDVGDADAERMRREIAERLERLSTQWNAQAATE